MPAPRYSVVVPVYNEEAVLPELHRRLRAVLDALGGEAELLFVDDGSRDGSLAVLTDLHHRDPSVKVLALSRNFGHQKAITAGLAHARGDYVAILDADLQDPPELLGELFGRLEAGADVAYGIRTRRQEGPLKRLAYFAWYRLLNALSDIDLPLDAGDFCVLRRRVVDVVNRLPERDRYLRGLRSWVGFRQEGVRYRRDPRLAGRTKYGLLRLLGLGADGLLSFSQLPLRLVGLMGLLVSGVSFAGILIVFYFRLFTDISVPGFAALATMLLFLGGVQLITLGVIGEYVGRVFHEAKRRPLFVVERALGFGPADGDAPR